MASMTGRSPDIPETYVHSKLKSERDVSVAGGQSSRQFKYSRARTSAFPRRRGTDCPNNGGWRHRHEFSGLFPYYCPKLRSQDERPGTRSMARPGGSERGSATSWRPRAGARQWTAEAAGGFPVSQKRDRGFFSGGANGFGRFRSTAKTSRGRNAGARRDL